MKILVAMSGGIDSSVIAHLLHSQGHDLVGVMMKLWTDPLAPQVRRAIPTKCCSVEHIQRARSVCSTLQIPFYVLDLEKEFKEEVVDPFLKDYEAGKTPNPCINCNRTIKFGKLLDKAAELGCEKVATGHYARIAEQQNSSGSIRYALLEATDKEKDQSYYLYGLTHEQRARVLFPLGDTLKTDVYALAESYNIPLYDNYRESQDLCFFPEREPREFLRRYLPSMQPGIIRTVDGTTVGTHSGLPLYTIGQRRGLGIGGLKIPLHVVEKRPADNELIVEESGKDKRSILHAINCQWNSSSPTESEKTKLDARISSLGNRHSGTLIRRGNTAEFSFKEPIRGIAPGQSVVWYCDEEVIGGGVIETSAVC